jgi:hypothetical protein
MIDTYLKSKNLAALEELRAFVINMIGPDKWSAATSEVVTADEVIPAQPAKGDPDYCYVCIRAPFPIMPYGEIEACSVEDGKAACGVWS